VLAAGGLDRSEVGGRRAGLRAGDLERALQRCLAGGLVGPARGREAPGAADPNADSDAFVLAVAHPVDPAVAGSDALCALVHITGVGVVGMRVCAVHDRLQDVSHG
jgi:hypothetical protein